LTDDVFESEVEAEQKRRDSHRKKPPPPPAVAALDRTKSNSRKRNTNAAAAATPDGQSGCTDHKKRKTVEASVAATQNAPQHFSPQQPTALASPAAAPSKEAKKAASWESFYQQLLQFKDIYGHCDVSYTAHKKDFFTLAGWVHRQRMGYQNRQHMAAHGTKLHKDSGTMSNEQFHQLSKLGIRFANKLLDFEEYVFYCV
jgi:hypothetical protein